MMFRKNSWPFIPVRLSEIMEKDMLAVIEAGCCTRLGRAVTIIDANQTNGNSNRIDAINLRQRFQAFCACLRDDTKVNGGNEACEECDRVAARLSLKHSHRSLYREFRCHVGLWDATYVIKVSGRPIAILFSGQYRPPEGITQIEKNVRNLGSGRFEHMKPVNESIRYELLGLAEQLPLAPADFANQLQVEAEFIQKIVEAQYQRVKNEWEQEFLDTLRESSSRERVNQEPLRQFTEGVLRRVKTFCRSDYVGFFASVQENDTVLAPLALIGVPANIKTNPPHFNWKKAGLPMDNADAKEWDIIQSPQVALRGIRGDNNHYFSNATCIIPTILGRRYRGVLVFGPFAEPIEIETERRFLKEVCNTIGSRVLNDLQVLYLQQERRRWYSTANLLTHQLRTTLTPITTQIGSARLLISQNFNRDVATRQIVNSLKRVEELCLRLGRSARETLEGQVLMLEPEDLEFERYPLSVLVANCAEGFITEAENRFRQLVIDKGVELLPDAEVDVARLTIALNNLIENAMKYSYPNTKISIRGRLEHPGDLAWARAVIEIQDLGDEIAPEDRSRIFEQGKRGLTRVKMGRIPGTGLGLWETRAVAEAHGGTVTCDSQPTAIYRRHGQAHQVTFSLKIPLRQLQRS